LLRVSLLLLSLTTLVAGGIGAATAPEGGRWAIRAGWMSCVAASLLGLSAAAQGFFARDEAQITGTLVFDALSYRVDWLATVFLAATFLSAPAVALYGAHDDLAIRRRWLPFVATITGATLAFTAHGVLLLLLAWELVALAGAWLAAHDVPAGGRRIVAAHAPLAMTFLAVVFWSALSENLTLGPDTAAAARVALPFAAAALVLSGRLRSDGAGTASHAFYRCLTRLMALSLLLRLIRLAGVPPVSIGIVLVLTGVVLAIGSALWPLAWERMTERVERQQMIVLMLGTGAALTGLGVANAALALLALAGVLMLAVGQTFCTLLVAFGVRAVKLRVAVPDAASLGGLARGLPDTTVTTFIGTLSSAGVPPFIGFGAGAFIAAGCAQALRSPARVAWAPLLAGVVVVLMQGRFAFQVWRTLRQVLLGEPRSEAARAARDVGSVQRVPMHMLAALTVMFGLFPVFAFVIVAPAAIQVTQSMLASRTNALDVAFFVLRGISGVSIVIALAAVAFGLWRARSARRVRQ
jgi:formate hydrogenlyase subunit 3/multisubunit Na+/H+ antiporter MnhD subunit